MFHTFEGSSAEQAWRNAAQHFRSVELPLQGSRAGENYEILHAAIAIGDPRQRWVLSRRPVINVAFALAEVIWILRGRDDSAFLNFFNSKLPLFAGNTSRYYGAYGFRLKHAFKFDQLDRAFEALHANPSSRQVVLQIWNAESDFPDEAGRPRSPDIPCNISSILKVKDGRLEWMQVMRSNDLFRGLPYNIVQFTTLQEVIAGWLGIAMGEYHHISDSLHLYNESAKSIYQDYPAEPISILNTDSLSFPKDESERYLTTLENRILQSIGVDVSVDRIFGYGRAEDLPIGFANIASVIFAEVLRRKGELTKANALMEKCTNPIFIYLFDEWAKRTKKLLIA